MDRFEFSFTRPDDPHPDARPSRRGETPTELERHVVERLSVFLAGRQPHFEPYEKEGCSRWVLDPGNNWWLDRDEQTGAFRLHYRYGGGSNAQRMAHLRATVLWIFGCEDWNPSTPPTP